MEHTHKNKLLKFGHFPEVGGGGSGLAQIVWSTFLFKEGIVFFFFLQGYYRGVTGVNFHGTNIVLTSGTSILIQGKSAPQVPKFHRDRGRGGCP